MKDFLKDCLKENFVLEKLKGDGGHRSYSRLKKDNQSFILMNCGRQDPSLKLFIETQKRLKPHVFVPKIFHYDLKKGLLLLEDLGGESLESCFLKKGELASRQVYQKAIRQLLRMQREIKRSQTDPCFDSAFFEGETKQALFDVEKYFTDELKSAPGKNSSKAFTENMKEITQSFLSQEFVFCHRDYHSRNLMLKQNETFMIDFQDAGWGPCFYDLASLLYDSYVSIKDKKIWYRFYYNELPENLKQKAGSVHRIEKLTELLFLQRGFKACGRFCAFKTENGKDSHLKYLKSTFQLLKQISEKHSCQRISKYLHFLLTAFK